MSRIALFCEAALLVLVLVIHPGFAQVPGPAEEAAPEPRFLNPSSMFEQFFFRPLTAAEQTQLKEMEISGREEEEYGERVLQSFLDDFKRQRIAVNTRGRQVEYIKKLVQTLQPQMSHRDRYRNLRVLVADSEMTDAYSIPGGTLILFRGMIEFADTEAALVGVVGHELAHLDRGHQLLPLKRAKLAKHQAQASARDPWAMFRQANLLMSTVLQPFRPEDELEADRDGATWAYRAGYDPRAMLTLFSQLEAKDRLGRFAPAFLRSHPYHADRGAAIDALYRQLQETEPRKDLYLGRANVRRLVPFSERRLE